MASGDLKQKDLTEDPIHDQIELALAWAMKYQRPLLVGLVALLGIGAASSLYARKASETRDSASLELLRGVTAYNDGDFTRARAVLNQLTVDFAGTSAGQAGLLYLGNALFGEGEFDAAEATYQDFLATGGQEAFLVLAANEGLAACAEERGQWAAAADAYESLIGEDTPEVVIARVLVAAGRCREQAGDLPAAVALYTRVVDEYPVAPYVSQARSARTMLDG